MPLAPYLPSPDRCGEFVAGENNSKWRARDKELESASKKEPKSESGKVGERAGSGLRVGEVGAHKKTHPTHGHEIPLSRWPTNSERVLWIPLVAVMVGNVIQSDSR